MLDTYNIYINGEDKAFKKLVTDSLNLINQKLDVMAENVKKLQADLDTANTTLDTVATNVTGIAADVTYLKDQLDAAADGATAEEIAAMQSTADSILSKVQTIADSTKSLDDSTDSSTPEPTPEPTPDPEPTPEPTPNPPTGF